MTEVKNMVVWCLREDDNSPTWKGMFNRVHLFQSKEDAAFVAERCLDSGYKPYEWNENFEKKS